MGLTIKIKKKRYQEKLKTNEEVKEKVEVREWTGSDIFLLRFLTSAREIYIGEREIESSFRRKWNRESKRNKESQTFVESLFFFLFFTVVEFEEDVEAFLLLVESASLVFTVFRNSSKFKKKPEIKCFFSFKKIN